MNDIGLRIRDADFPAEHLENRAMSDATTLGDVVAALRRQYLPLVLLALLGMFVGAAHHVTTPKQYYTSATVLVDERRNELDQAITSSLPFARNDTSLLNEIQVLKSLQLATEVARRLDLQDNDVFIHPPSSLARSIVSGTKARIASLLDLGETGVQSTTPDPELQRAKKLGGAASKLQRDIRITRIGLSFSIEISYIGHDPSLAADIVNTFASAYLDDGLSANMESTERAAEWMRNQLDELETNSAAILVRAAEMRQNDPTKVAELRELARLAATLDTLYQTISARYEQISIQGSFPVSNGRILTLSTAPETAALPKLWQTLAVTTLLGLMAGFAVAVLREARERSFRVSTDVYNYTGRTFLGHLPQIATQDLSDAPPPKTKEIMFGSRRRSAEGVPNPDGSPNDHATIEWQRRRAKELSPQLFWSVLMPQSMFSETLRNIHASVDLYASNASSTVVAVTSMLPQEGKTTLAVNYANMLAKSGARTLLIDMDLHGFSIGRALQIPEGPGIVEVLRGGAPLSDALQRLDLTGLNVLPSGRAQQHSVTGEVLYQQNMQALMVELRKDYDYVVLDMPPLGKVSDAKAIIAQLDKIVLVCEWGKTPRSLVTQYLAHEPEISQKVAGITLSKVNVRELQKYARPGWPESYLGADRRIV